MSRKQLNRMLFIENILIGAAAIVVGIGTGLLFSKLILLISAKLLAVDTGLPFYFPLKALLITAAAYAVLFLLIALCSSFMLRKGAACARESGGKSQTAPKASPWLAVLAVLLIGAGYGMVLVLRFSKSLILFCCLEALFSLSSARIFSSPSSAYILCGICRRRSDFSSVEPIC